MSGKRNTYVIPELASRWSGDGGLGLADGEAFRCTSLLTSIAKPALIGWAAKQEGLGWQRALRQVLLDRPDLLTRYLEGADTADALIETTLDMRKILGASERQAEKARDIGTAAHGWIEWRCKSLLDPQDYRETEPVVVDEAAMVRDAFTSWADTENLRPCFVEQLVWSAADRWAGTLDLACRIGPGAGDARPLAVVDVKSSSGIYTEHMMQVAAYCMALNEMGLSPELPRGVILRLPKTTADFDALREKNGVPYDLRVIEDEEVVEHYQAFLSAKNLYENMRRLNGARKDGATHE